MDEGISSRTITIVEHEEIPEPPDPASHITVDIADSGSAGSTYTITWNDVGECRSDYRAYLTREGPPIFNDRTGVYDKGWTSYHILGTTGPEATQLVETLDEFPLTGQRVLRVHCGDIGRLVSEVPLPSRVENSIERPVAGTYSSEPALTMLTVSPGTLAPAFANHGFLYAVLDVPYDSNQITLNATAKAGYTISWDPATDADPNMDGHQVNLAEGYNSIFASVDHDQGVNSFLYEAIVKRAGSSQQLPNTPATGQPLISGTVQVGETLTAEVSGIADADGLNNAAFSYQWVANDGSSDTDIQDATGSTYTLADDDEGKTIQVRVSFTDDAGNGETLTSAATVPVAASPESGPAVTLELSPSGSVAEGTEITVAMSFGGLEQDADTTTKDYVFRADVKQSDDSNMDVCEDRANGYGLGVDRNMWQVDQDPETRTGTVSANCPSGAYVLLASIATPGGVELASARANFAVGDPGPPPSSDAALSGLALSGVNIGAFDPATTGYTASVGNNAAETTVTPTMKDDGAAYVVKLDGVADVDGTVSLAVGSNTITIEVTAEDGQATRTYTVTVTRAAPPSDDATLSGLALSGVTLEFDSDTTGYTAEVANDVAETTVTATTNDDGAAYVVKLDGASDDDGVIPLAVGENVITVEVTAEDGQATRTYTVTVTRTATTPEITIRPLTEEEWNGISPRQSVSIVLSPSGEVEPGTEITVTMSFGGLEHDADADTKDYIFRADVVGADQCEDQGGGYGLGVERHMYKVDENPEVRTGTISSDCPAGDYTVKASISSPNSVELALASTNFTVLSLEQQQRESEPLSTDATLSALTLSGVNIGAYDPPTTEYTAHVGNDVTETTVTPTTNDEGATYMVKLGGVTDEDGTVFLSVGSNLITIEVTAEDGLAVKTYSVAVTRAAPLSTDATLSNLTLSGVKIGSFDPATVAYSSRVAHDVMETTVTATTNDDGAAYVVKLDGVTDNDGTVSLAVGSNVITVEVTAEDGQATKTYTVTITRAAPLSDDATLSGLALSGVNIGAFDPATTGYTAEVANDVVETTVTPAVNDDGATYVIKLDGAADYDGTLSLAVGSNVITVEVTAEDGQTTRAYTITITRAEPPSTDATLSNLALSGVAFGTFDSATTGYTASVANDVAETTVTPTVNDGGATYVVKLDGTADNDGAVSLAVGSNVVTVEVTAEDGQTTRTYTVTVTRAAPDATATIGLSPSGSVVEGTEIAVVMTFANLTLDDNANLVFRADVVDADACEGQGIGVNRNMYKVDEDPEVRTGTISGDCTAGDYTLEVRLTSSDDVELAMASAGFTVAAPETEPAPEPVNPPDVPDKPTGEVTGKGQVQLDWNDVAGATYYQVRFYENPKADWVELPTGEIGIVIDGSAATVSSLPNYGFYYFSVRAGNAAGLSDWSDFLQLANTEE